MDTFSVTSIINSVWPSDAIWWHRSGSTLAHLMACCLRAQTITQTVVEFLSIRSNDIQMRATSPNIPSPTITKIIFKIIRSRISFKSSWGQWVNYELFYFPILQRPPAQQTHPVNPLSDPPLWMLVEPSLPNRARPIPSPTIVLWGCSTPQSSYASGRTSGSCNCCRCLCCCFLSRGLVSLALYMLNFSEWT